MSYFPAFIQLQDKKVLLVGGGNIAYEKLERLLDFTHDIYVIALDLSEKMHSLMQEHNIKYEQKAYVKGDIKDYCIVVVAVDDISLQKDIFEESKAYKCLCNAVDSVSYCDFIFPSYIKEGHLTIAISTSGASPSFAKYFKKYIKNLVPKNVANFLDEMQGLRETLPKGEERMKVLDEKTQEYMKTFT
ncbi:bifunctional precorrin-2 dehydrogenase/sirohydrochlorin ferrochelatase [Sulfurimonas sp. MAG313]|nr:bifunctional precorrin-2 dehydrogenase/sirohydrochlorin ferrochelatase [Sulfurimonas sp. MAG313]MDF1880142.1 bifunctional precorrin-2 dehydrogenase/sirohydrochlorin ferrochelatase [Sulfurimonas sp. MAG313]